MDKSDALGGLATHGGALLSCGAAQAAYNAESTMLLFLSATGTVIAVFGLIYTIWNGNRQYQLARQELELKRLELLDEKRTENIIRFESAAEGGVRD